jgi:Tocopherol cyclase
MLDAYRRTGADPPFGDPRGYHGVGMEGYYWRLTGAADGRVVVVLLAVSRDAAGRPWGMVGYATHPGGFVRAATVQEAWADPRGLGVRLGDVLEAGEDRLRVDLGPDARLDVRFGERVGWPRRAFGGIGPAQLVPGLSQYWHPHLLGARVTGSGQAGDTRFDLDGASAYAEKNWGRGGMPPAWWWGQAQGFERPDVCVAFAGGRAGLGRFSVGAGALVVRLGPRVLRVVSPLQPLRVAVDEAGWRLRGRAGRHLVDVRGHAGAAPAHLLPVPVPRERRHLDAWAPQHLAGTLRLRVSRGGRTVFEGASSLAGLERGRGHRAHS